MGANCYARKEKKVVHMVSSAARILQLEGLRMTSHLTIRCIISKDGLKFKRDDLS